MDSISHSKAIKFLLSISVFSILFTHSPLISFLVQFSNALISSLSVRLLSYSFDKNYMFLLCNGLLVCIVKNSGLVGTSTSGSNLNKDEGDVNTNVETPEVGVVELTETKTQKAKEDQVINVEPEQVEEDDEEEDCRNVLVNVEDHDEFEGEEEVGILSTEELNKKCDEFIRRVREGIKLESNNL